MTGYRVWSRDGLVEIETAEVHGEAVPTPVATALLFEDDSRQRLMLQRRADGGPAHGLWELPGGIWGAGESPHQALAREVLEETGLELVVGSIGERRSEAQTRRPHVSSHPAVVVTGVGEAYPVLILAYECIALPGEPQGELGESEEPTFFGVEAVREMLSQPQDFTGPTFAILSAYLD